LACLKGIYDLFKSSFITNFGDKNYRVGLPLGRLALGRLALGRLALGRLALGRLALGRLALGRLALGRLALGRLAAARLAAARRLAAAAARRRAAGFNGAASALAALTDTFVAFQATFRTVATLSATAAALGRLQVASQLARRSLATGRLAGRLATGRLAGRLAFGRLAGRHAGRLAAAALAVTHATILLLRRLQLSFFTRRAGSVTAFTTTRAYFAWTALTFRGRF
jgi:hypothetical protein